MGSFGRCLLLDQRHSATKEACGSSRGVRSTWIAFSHFCTCMPYAYAGLIDRTRWVPAQDWHLISYSSKGGLDWCALGSYARFVCWSDRTRWVPAQDWPLISYSSKGGLNWCALGSWSHPQKSIFV